MSAATDGSGGHATIVQDPLSGKSVVVTAGRQARPDHRDADAERSGGCPFCPGGLEAPEPYTVRWFVNRWPAMEGDRCEVVLYSPDHGATFATLGADGARRVVELWAARTAALAARPDVEYVLVFENRGADVGATVSHPHGQIYAFAALPEAPLQELEPVRRRGSCSLCGEEPGARLVCEAGTWRCWIPAAAGWPYELLLAPEAHAGMLGDAGADRNGLAACLADALGRLDALFGAPMPYMLWIHQRPCGEEPWPEAHLHVHVAGVWRSRGMQRYVAAGELGSGVLFNPVEPEEAAVALRAGRPGAPRANG